MKQRNWMQRIADSADLPDQPLPGQTIVEILGQNRVLIEHHMGVTEYSTERIRIKVCYGTICVCGEKLELTRMRSEQLIITGCVDSVSLIGRR
jgi:sporulation protein YqfC